METIKEKTSRIGQFLEGDWAKVFAIAATCLGLWLHMDYKFWTYQSEMSNKFESFQLAMAQESKDFHARLAVIEEKYHQLEKKN